MEEIWKDIPGYEGKYQVSSHGRVRSLARKYLCSNGTINQVKNRFLKPATDGCGYFRCALSNNKKLVTHKVHRLVAKAFVKGETKNRFQVNHIDGNKKNNHFSNLEWSSPSENCQHSFDIGTQLAKRGELNGRAIINSKIASEIKRLRSSGETCSNIAKKYNVKTSLVKDISRGRTWKHV